ncbi:hypothetical protein RF11_10806 [Thelohanellus kitauei]|uniref:CUB domain-containing protein n=1 Tax=Thelohanellus kitauei TaxID=669202 RepID=A0A0C2JGP2_THEKT|nr:hypothetical protein RF11_10806 [Thelohanellus kitauei]
MYAVLLAILLSVKLFRSQDYEYLFNYIYNFKEPSLCLNGVCAINFDLGGKTQTFPSSEIRFYNPNLMLCGLEFKIVRVAQIDQTGHEIPFFTANMNKPQRLFYAQPTVSNYCYCNPQIQLTSTSSTAFPFSSPGTTVVYPYTKLDCSPVQALLSSTQVYLTNGTRLDHSFGVLDIDVSVFRSRGYMLNFPRNATQFVKPGDVWINFTLSRFEWAGDVPCESEKKSAEGVIITFYVAGKQAADLINDTYDVGNGRSQAYNMESGIAVMTGVALKDDEIIQVLPKYLGTEPSGYRSFFSLRLARFEQSYSYEGVYLFQDPQSTCGGTLIGNPGEEGEVPEEKCL